MPDRPESPRNIGVVCDLHAPRPQRHFTAVPPQAFVGHYVQRAFGTRQGSLEHMWVYVDRVTPEGHLEGRLDNDPVHDCGVVCGDTVTVALVQIEAVSP